MLKHVSIVAMGLAIALAAACNLSGDRDKANKMVDEANASIADAKKLFDDGAARFKEAISANPAFEDREKLEAPMKDVISKFETAQGKMRDAAQKMDDASKLNIEDWYKQYLSTFAQRVRKESELADAFMKMAKDSYDPSIDSDEERSAKLDASGETISKLDKERSEIQAKLDQIGDEHKGEFKK